jgi:hypothetical protein
MMNDHMTKQIEYSAEISRPETIEIIVQGENLATIKLGKGHDRKHCRKIVSATDSHQKKGETIQKGKGFRRYSRLRLKRKFAMLQSISASMYFVTLTLPDIILDKDQNPEELVEQAKEFLNSFFDRLEYRYKKLGCIWRLEFEQRASGRHEGYCVPHFHLLLYIPKSDTAPAYPHVTLKLLREHVAKMWYKAVGSGDPSHLAAGTQVERICWRKDRERIAAYMSKVSGDGDDISVRRRWGIRGKKNMPWAEPVTLILPREQGLKVWSFFRNFAGIPAEAHWRLPSLSVFISTSWLLANLSRLVT